MAKYKSADQQTKNRQKMNIQQLKYVMALDRFRNFAKAAESCNVSQPTLSAMLVKL